MPASGDPVTDASADGSIRSADVKVVIEKSDNIWIEETGTYSLKEEDCSVMWVVEVQKGDEQKITLRTRYPIGVQCSKPFMEQLPLHRRMIRRILEDWDAGRFKTLFTGPLSRLEPTNTWNIRIAAAAAASPDWKEYNANYPRHDHGKTSNTMFVEVVNDANACRELVDLFNEFGLKIKLDSVEKVFAQKPSKLPFQKDLKERGIEGNPTLMYDAGMNYFTISEIDPGPVSAGPGSLPRESQTAVK